LDINFNNAVTARPPFELAWLFVFGVLWLGGYLPVQKARYMALMCFMASCSSDN
jgi:hypothetical protein